MLGPDESIVDCGEDNVCPPDINQPHSERDLYEGGLTFIWNGSYCEDVIIYSSKNLNQFISVSILAFIKYSLNS